MRGFLTFGLVVCFLVVSFGCAHTSDSSAGMPGKQEIAQAQPNAAPPQEVAPVQTNAAPVREVPMAQVEGAPRVELAETVFDFGLVADGSDHLHSFKIRNAGTMDLVIKKIMPG